MPCSRRAAERTLKVLLRTLAVAPVNIAGARRIRIFLRPGRCPQGTRQRMTKAPAGLTYCDQPGKTGYRTRDPLLAEEPVMSITAWIVPWPAARPPGGARAARDLNGRSSAPAQS